MIFGVVNIISVDLLDDACLIILSSFTGSEQSKNCRNGGENTCGTDHKVSEIHVSDVVDETLIDCLHLEAESDVLIFVNNRHMLYLINSLHFKFEFPNDLFE